MGKPPILFIHGMWGRAELWDQYRSRFEAAGHATHAITLRHHDTRIDQPAPAGLGQTSLTDYVEDILSDMRGMEEAPILIGHSMGGLLAQLVAARTEHVRAVIGLTPGPPAGVFAISPRTLNVFRDILLTPAFWKKPTRLSFSRARYGLLHNMSPEAARQLYQEMVWESGRATAEIAFWLFDKSRASRVEPEKIPCPVLLLSGEKDRTVSPGVVRAAVKRYKGACDYRQLAGHSHWVLGEEGWEDIADLCLEWISGLTTPNSTA